MLPVARLSVAGFGILEIVQKLIEVNDTLVKTPENGREVYMVLTTENESRNLKGHAGCNSLGGNYTVDGNKIKFQYEKDKSTGTIRGEMKGDTVFAKYKFTSEGMESNREVALLKKENSFVMGYGEILNSGNKDIFKNRNAIKFSDGVVLTKVVCK